MNKGYAFISLQLFGLHRLAVTLFILLLAITLEAKASTPLYEASTPFYEAHTSSIDASVSIDASMSMEASRMSIDASSMFIEEPSKPVINAKKPVVKTNVSRTKANRKAKASSEALVKEGERLSQQGETARSLMVLNRYIESFAYAKASRADSLLLTRALMRNARNYEDLGNQHQALVLLQRALSVAKHTGDKRHLAALYNNIFAIYYSLREFDQAEDLLQMSLQLSIAAADSASIRNNYNNFGLVCYERRQYDRALSFMDKALAYAPRADRVGMSLIYTNRAEVFTRQNRLPQAERALQKALDLQRGQQRDNRTVQTRLNMTFLKARLGKRTEALTMQHALYKTMPHLPLAMQANAYEQMADVCFNLGDSLAALRNILRFMPLNDSLQRADNNSQLQQLLVAYDADRLKQHNTNLAQTVDIYRLKAEGRTRLLAVAVPLLVILIVLVVLLWRRMRTDRAKNKLISEQQQQLLIYEQQEREREQQEMLRKQEEMRRKQEEMRRKQEALKRKQEEMAQRQEEMSLELDHKNRQLTSYTLDLAAVNEFHQHVSASLSALREKKLSAAEADNELKDLILSLQHFNDKPLGDDFRVYFDEVHPGFLMRLSQQFSALSKADLRLCAYLHLGMTTKEIAALTFKEVRSVESARNRLRKKLNLPPETNLAQFLEQFTKDAP